MPEGLASQIVEHCLAELPNEGCGLLAADDVGDIVAVYPTSNEDQSATGFTVPPAEHFAALQDADSNGWELAGVFHSHPQGPARPSTVDVLTALDPQWVYLVVGLSAEPVIRAWRIRDKKIEEILLG